MGSIYLDKQSNNWKHKTNLNGKDSRQILRKSTPQERDAWSKSARGGRQIPLDLLKRVQSESRSVSIPPVKPAVVEIPTDLLGFIEWFEGRYPSFHREGTTKRMKTILRRFKEFIDHESRQLTEVKQEYLEAFFNWRLDHVYRRTNSKTQPHVVVAEFTALSGLFTEAVERDLIPKNPMKHLLKTLRKSYPEPIKKPKYLDRKELESFLERLEIAVSDGIVPLIHADVMKLLLSSGIRVSAGCQLDYSWIDKNWHITIPAEHDKGKTGYSTVLSSIGQDVIKRRRKESGGKGRVFPDVKSDAIRHYARKLRITPHQLRHSFATILVDKDVSIQTISDLLGHKDVKTTQIYAKVRDEAKRAAVAKLDF
jgi:integrase